MTATMTLPEISTEVKRLISESSLKKFIYEKINDISGFNILYNPEKAWSVIHCNTPLILLQIVRILEKDEYYGKRMCVREVDKDIHLSLSEKPQINANVSLFKLFLNYLVNLFLREKIYFEVITPIIVMASKKEKAEIKFKFKDLPSLNNFIIKIKRKGWSEEKIDNETASVFISEKQIRLFLSEERVDFQDNQTEKKSEKVIFPGPIGSILETLEQEKVDSQTTVGKEDKIVHGIVYESMNYDEFHYFPFNRKIKIGHVKNLIRSMEIHGSSLSFATIVDTNCIDGTLRRYYADGQHRGKAWEIRKEPILFTKKKANSIEELVQLIADLNTTSKNWTLREYLHVWSSLKIRTYMVIEKYLNETKLPITLILEIFSGVGRGAATKMLQRGKFKIKNIKTARKHIEWVCELKKFLPKSRDIMSALVIFFNKKEGYDNERMKVALGKASGNIFSPGEKLEEILVKLEKIYFVA